MDEAALLIAAHARPGLDVDAQLARLDSLAADVTSPTLDGLRHQLFDVMGFIGNVDDYEDPDNSFLDQVLDRRTGIPITLSVLMMEVGRRIGVPLSGIGMPGHFLVRHDADPVVYVDPFAGGVVLDERGCEARFRALHGPAAPFSRAFLAPTPPLAILTRMLNNLRAIYTTRGPAHALTWVRALRTLLPGGPESN